MAATGGASRPISDHQNELRPLPAADRTAGSLACSGSLPPASGRGRTNWRP